MMMLARLMLYGWIFALILVFAWFGALFNEGGGSTLDGEEVTSRSPSSFLAEDETEQQERPAMAAAPECTRFEPAPVVFDEDSAAIGARTSETIDGFGRELRAVACVADTVGNFCAPAEIEIAVLGHADASTSTVSGGNARLSFDRALAVATRLRDADFTIRAVEGYGAAQPALVDESGRPSAAVRAEDRRAEIELWCPRQWG